MSNKEIIAAYAALAAELTAALADGRVTVREALGIAVRVIDVARRTIEE